MRVVTWAIRLILFIVLLAFAVKNTEPVVLRFYFGAALELPLALLAFGFFAAGAGVGVVAALGTALRQRREIIRLKRESRQRGGATPRPDGEPGARAVPPIADV